MRKQALNTRKPVTTAPQVEQTAPESGVLMHVAAAEQPAAQDAPEVAPAAEAEQPSPLAIAADTAPVADFVPMLTPAPRSLDELLDLVRKAKSVTERLTAYKATSEKLGGFELGKEGFTDRLTIKDGNGMEWSTSQSTIIEKVLGVLRGELSTAIDATEAELRQMLPVAA